MHSITTSIRLSAELRARLEQVSQSLHRGKNWIINEALEEYLIKLEYDALASEAQRQSLLAGKSDQATDELWQDNTDTSGWV